MQKGKRIILTDLLIHHTTEQSPTIRGDGRSFSRAVPENSSGAVLFFDKTSVAIYITTRSCATGGHLPISANWIYVATFYLHLFSLKAILAISYGTKEKSKSICRATYSYY